MYRLYEVHTLLNHCLTGLYHGATGHGNMCLATVGYILPCFPIVHRTHMNGLDGRRSVASVQRRCRHGLSMQGVVAHSALTGKAHLLSSMCNQWGFNKWSCLYCQHSINNQLHTDCVRSYSRQAGGKTASTRPPVYVILLPWPFMQQFRTLTPPMPD